MSIQDTHETIGRLVAAQPVRARVFEKLGIDYCCGGRRPLDEVAREKGIALDLIVRELDALDIQAPAGAHWLEATSSELIAHIQETHHSFLREELPALGQLVQKVAGVHAEKHPELEKVRMLFDRMSTELSEHMLEEEQVLFPMMRTLAAGEPSGLNHCGGIQNPLLKLRLEHEEAGRGLAEIRSLTGDYSVPEGACNSYRAMLTRLELLEKDLHEHVHEEENILFPRFPGTA